MAIANKIEAAIVQKEDAGGKIARHASLLSQQLQELRTRMYPPKSEKSLRPFLTNEVSKLTSIPDSTLKLLSSEGRGPVPGRLENNHRVYTLAQINELRELFASQKPADALRFLPRRREGEHLQVVAIANFKGGSAKTTTCVHLAHYLALQGYRVLALDLDPQASLSALFGAQPEFDVGANETIYAALRYDDAERRPIRDIIRKTYFDGIDLIPGNLEVMEYEHETPRVLAQKSGSGAIFFERLKLVLADVDQDYDVVILDPPAFIKRRKDFTEGRLAYRRLNELGMQVLAKDGILVTCSCSHHMPRATLLESVQQGVRHLDRQAQALIQLQQSADHPVHPAIPETDYLKGFVCRVLPA